MSPTSSSSTSSPHKRQPSERVRRTSLAASPSSRTLNGIPDRAGAESVLGGLIHHGLRSAGPGSGAAGSAASAEQHHRLLFSALEQFEAHFGAADAGGELVSRMDALVNSTTRLNGGLRGLAQHVREAQVAAQLDEDRLGAGAEGDLAPFEKSVAALLRASDDQVRCLTEDMVAFARLDRERERRARREGGADVGAGASRPVSRASTYRSSMGGGGAALLQPQQRQRARLARCSELAQPLPRARQKGGLARPALARARRPALVRRDGLGSTSHARVRVGRARSCGGCRLVGLLRRRAGLADAVEREEGRRRGRAQPARDADEQGSRRWCLRDAVEVGERGGHPAAAELDEQRRDGARVARRARAAAARQRRVGCEEGQELSASTSHSQAALMMSRSAKC